MGSLCLLQDTDLDNIFSGEALNTKVLFQIKVDLIKVSQISTLVMSCHVFFTNGNTDGQLDTDGDTNVDTTGVESSVGWILWNLKNILVPA